MSILWTMGEVARVTRGISDGDGAIARVVIDSRQAGPGDLFIAIQGERFDGHDFAAQALAQGATAALVSRRPKGLPEHAPVILVKDTLQALNDLAKVSRARSSATFVGVTGSVGKTSAKDALKLCLAADNETFATSGNLNNHIGLPLSLVNLPMSAKYGVFELGMNHAGEIAALSALLRPQVALITTVESVHIEFFESEEGIADAKAEIFSGMAEGGTAILPAGNRHFARLKESAQKSGLNVVSFGAGEEAEYRLDGCRLTEHGTEAQATLRGTPVTVRMAAFGEHWGLAAVAVLAAAEAAGADLPKAAEALAQFREPVGRGRVSLVKLRHGEITLIDDSYNASPASMRAAFDKLRALKDAMPKTGRTIAVLGDMLELGSRADELHVGLVPSLVNNQIDLIFSAGPLMRKMFDKLPESMRGLCANDAASLAPDVIGALRPRDLVLVKGSHGSKMHQLAHAIQQAGEANEPENEHAL